LIYRTGVMIRMALGILSFQTLYVSREQSNCPLISDMIRIDKKLKELEVLKDTTGAMSLEYGKRMVIQRAGSRLDDLKIDDFAEIVDYDPLKRIMLVIGRNEPCVEAPVHWIIHHARDDVNAILQLNGEKTIERFSKRFPTTEKTFPQGTLELAKESLKTLRKSKNIILKDVGVLFVGADLKEVEDSVLKNIEEST